MDGCGRPRRVAAVRRCTRKVSRLARVLRDGGGEAGAQGALARAAGLR
jgi:hypothetical protein